MIAKGILSRLFGLLLSAGLTVVVSALGLFAEDVELDSAKTDKPWDVAEPHVPSDTVTFTVSEGTWITVDVHSDGSRLVFDLVGDIYTMPIEGGQAELISGGLPYEVQPRFSPDGKQILFTSDRGGGDNIWVMNADGSDRRAITNQDFRLLNNGAWHPDGKYIVARKHFTSERSMGAGEMWLYRIDDGGSGVRLTEKKNVQQDAGEPIFSPDGSYLYWSEDMSGGNTFQYNKDPHQRIYMIRRLDMKSGEIRNLISLNGGACRPQISPDGETMAFIRRIRTKSVLCLYDLESGVVRNLWDGVDRDQQETWAIFGVYPGFDWTPDGKEIVITAKGKLWRVDVESGRPTEIPFTCITDHIIANALRFPIDAGRSSFDVKVIRWPQITSDEQSVIFSAMGYLHTHDIESSKSQRLTKQTDEYEFAPRLSADGQYLAYVTWNDRSGGRVKMMKTDGKSVRELVSRPGHYQSAALSADNKRLVYHRGGGDGYRGVVWDEDPGIYLLDLSGDATPLLLTREGYTPQFSPDGQRIFLNANEGDQAALISVNLLGTDRRVHAVSERAFDLQLSPDQKWIAFEELWQTYVTPFPKTSQIISLAPKMKNLPVKQLSEVGGTYLSWSPNSKKIRWSLGPELSELSIDSLFVRETPDESDTTEEKSDKEFKPTTYNLSWASPADQPSTDLYLTNARILPMHDMSVIENGVIHIKGNRIEAIGSTDQVAVPEGAHVIDLEGRTVSPGYVDIHAHVGTSWDGIHSQQSWSYLANLAFGTTTIHDPSNSTQMIHADAELVEAGQKVGPRIYSTGTILYGAEGDFKTVINSYEDALNAVKRTAAWGAISVKSYNQPRRNQRQMVIKAGLEERIMVVPEGGSTLHHNINMILDGHTTIEHAIPVAPLYEPELKLLSEFGTAYTPTFVVAYGGQSGERYFYEHTNVWENERLLNFVPRSRVDPNSIRRSKAPDSEYHHITIAESAAEVYRRGGMLEIGSHGQMQGLASHWEIWSIVQGGLSNHEALRAATYLGAKAIGLNHKLGSLQSGLLADLIVYDADPLADIYQSENIKYVMINGRLFDAMSMDQIAPEEIPLPPGPFTDEVTEADIGRHDCLADH